MFTNVIWGYFHEQIPPHIYTNYQLSYESHLPAEIPASQVVTRKTEKPKKND